MHRPFTRSLLAIASAAFCVAASAAPPLYRIATIQGPNGEQGCFVSALNDHGEVVGSCGLGGFKWSAANGSQAIDDASRPQASLYLTGINNAGVVTGQRFESADRPVPGFIWDATNGFTYFGSSQRGWEPRAINDDGVVVGHSAARGDSQFVWKAFRWTAAGGLELLQPAQDRRTLAQDINERGEIVGSFERVAPEAGPQRPVLQGADGSNTALLPGQREGVAHAINGAGRVAGAANNRAGQPRAMVWAADTGAQVIDQRPGVRNWSTALDLNDAGQVVGQLWEVTGNTAKEQPFYWDEVEGLLDLRTLIDPDDPLAGAFSEFFADTIRINDAGQIMLTAYGETVGQQSILLTPNP